MSGATEEKNDDQSIRQSEPKANDDCCRCVCSRASSRMADPVDPAELPAKPSRTWPRVHMLGVTAASLVIMMWGTEMPWPVVAALCGLIAWSMTLHVAGRTLDIKSLLDTIKTVGTRR